MLRLLTSSLVISLTAASFCGDSAIPFSLEVLPGGQPVLGCARPSCFGFAATGHPVSNAAGFYRINDHVDGFVRAGVETIPPFGANDPRFYRPQAAMCEPTPASAGCPGVNQWVGGIAPLLNVTAFPTTLQCCAYDVLLQSEDRGTASIEGGQIVRGGEVFKGDLQVGFDYISDVAKIIRVDGSVQYDVAVRRMPCADFAGAAKTTEVAQAFQAPNLPVNQPLPLPLGPQGPQEPAGPQGGSQEVLEELIQEEAFQLPPGTQFQPPPPPPPQPQLIPQQPAFIPPPQAPAPYYPPTYYGGGGGGGGGGNQWCFTDDMTVELIDGSTKRMDELEKRDWILSVNEEELAYIPVEFWLHRVPEQEAEFNLFETSDGKTIKLTDKHYIFKGDCSKVNDDSVDPLFITQTAVTADSVHVGDCLYSVEKEIMHEVRVVRSSKVTQKGIYAPMTSSGRIIVNGIHASCHAIMQDNILQQTAYDTVNTIYQTFFGAIPEDVVETPTTLSTMLAMVEVLIPKYFVEL